MVSDKPKWLLGELSENSGQHGLNTGLLSTSKFEELVQCRVDHVRDGNELDG